MGMFSIDENCYKFFRTKKDYDNFMKDFKPIIYGKWIVLESTEDSSFMECSNCHTQTMLYGSTMLGTNFCPNCGADLRGKTEEEKC